jgi:hypothetical protein
MSTQTTTWVYTAEQKEQWDKQRGMSGYHQVVGGQAYTYLVHTIARLVDNPDDPKTVLLIGAEERCAEFLKEMVKRETIDAVLCHQPKFFRFEDRDHDGEQIDLSLQSEMDAERFRNFIATSVEKEYYPIAAVVIFDEGLTDGKPYRYLDKVLEVPQWKNNHLVKTIRPAVFNVSDCEDSYFTKECSDAVSVDWRKDVKTYFELSQEKPLMLIEHLIPEKALTIMAAPSYTGKTHIAIEMGLSMATGTAFLDHFKGPAQPVPVSYHVPELHESLFHDFSDRLGARERLQECPENFLIRTLEHDLWQLNSPQMVDSSRGRYVFLDTVGYFNDADDSASYTQAIEFAKKINNLIREGCLGVCALYHPPKYSKSKKETGNVMTLENAPPPKTLIAVAGCHKFRERANNQRATWVGDVVGADVKFFVGHPIDNRTPLPDEVWLDCPDSWLERKQKVLAIIRWAMEHGYEYLWKVDDDVYLRPERLLSVKFFDYCGMVAQVRYVDEGVIQECSLSSVMGAVCGLSKRSMGCLLERDVRPDFRLEDGWTFLQLANAGIPPFSLTSWIGFPLWHGVSPLPYDIPKFAPHPSNSVLASFEYVTPEQMLAIHAAFRD